MSESEALAGERAEAPGTQAAPEPPGPGPEESVGTALAQARQALGLSLEDVAQQLKFGARQIEALEAGRFERLHGVTFARGMVRSYARLVKLDPDPLLERIAGRVARPAPIGSAVSFRRPIPFSNTVRRTNFAYVVLSLAVLAIGAAVAFKWHQERSPRRAPLAFVPAARAPLEPPRAPASAAAPAAVAPVPAVAGAPAAPARSGPAVPATSGNAPATEAGKAPAAPASAPSTVAAPVTAHATAPATLPAPADHPAAPGKAGRVVLSFEQESWVEVRDASGKRLLAQLNAPGTTQVLSGEAPLSLVIGNAQHVRVTYDGKPVDLTPYTKVEVAHLTLD